jgi:prepilin-type N-terminal cleavage/methylation domain-containing protein
MRRGKEAEMRTRSSAADEGGFTLVEVVVAMVIFTIFVSAAGDEHNDRVTPLSGTQLYTGRSSQNGCGESTWTANDTVNGPLHSNDALQIAGAVNFTSPTTETSWPATIGAPVGTKTWWGSAGAGSLSGKSPKYGVPIALPDANTTLSTRTTPGADGAQTGPGCYYTGATKITFTGSTMSVWSPSTSSVKTPARCLNISQRSNEQFGLAIPAVIYVDATSSLCSYKAIGFPVSNEAVNVGGSDSTSWVSTGSTERRTIAVCVGRRTSAARRTHR